MLGQATRANSQDRLDLRTAAVADLPFDNEMFDVTVSANTMQFWPDLAAGLREIRRVTRPGGAVLIAWHGGSAPTRIQRRLLLTDSELAGIRAAIGEHIGQVDHLHLTHSELFNAVVQAAAINERARTR